MKNFLRTALAIGLVVVALSTQAKAQTVVLDGLGSSALFLQLGLAANSSSGPIDAPCVWSDNTNASLASDSSTGSTETDKGSSWVAWTTGSDGTCATAGNIYAYLQTDSVVGNRCLFNSNLSTRECFTTYPTTPPSPAGLILSGGTANCGTTGECPLPSSVVTALNSTTQLVNFAGTDIRPEDAEFAVTRALVTTANCGSPVTTGSQYLGLGYSNGGNILSAFSSSVFHVISFSLPSSFTVTPVGATPIVVVVNGDGTSSGFSNTSITNITSQALAYFLDGTYSYTQQVLSPTGTGDAATVLIREPLSGTYNTMEYNVPNRVGTVGGSSPTFATSQDVGANQLSAQVNCNGTVAPTTAMNISTASGGARKRAIGTGQELAEVLATPNSLGYGFWSTANFANYTGAGSAANAKYLTVDGVDPLLQASLTGTTCTTGVLPNAGTAQIACVDLHTTADGNYPIWSLLRLVTVGSAPTALTELATAAQGFVPTGTTAARPDFVIPAKLNVVRSHFTPPLQTVTPANGDRELGGALNAGNACSTLLDAGGDVGGVVIGLRSATFTESPLTLSDTSYCSTNHVTVGQTGHRR